MPGATDTAGGGADANADHTHCQPGLEKLFYVTTALTSLPSKVFHSLSDMAGAEDGVAAGAGATAAGAGAATSTMRTSCATAAVGSAWGI